MVYLFDFFGVISSEVAPVWFEKYLPEYDIAELRSKYVLDADLGKTPVSVLYATLAELSNQSPDEVARQWRELAVINQEVVRVLKTLTEDNRVALLSNSPAEFIRPILQQHNLEALFEVIVISGEVGMVKPNLDIYLYILDKLNANPEDVLYIDDNDTNIEVAHSLGMNTLLYKKVFDIANLEP
jgi:putative hydrolase of the HAD superfamily